MFHLAGLCTHTVKASLNCFSELRSCRYGHLSLLFRLVLLFLGLKWGKIRLAKEWQKHVVTVLKLLKLTI